MTEQRENVQDRRGATTAQATPTGDGLIVLEYARRRLEDLIVAYSDETARQIMDAKALRLLLNDLDARAEIGKVKYGTYLRVNNGRSAILDLYQELTDAVMYSAQARMEGDVQAGNMLELLINLASQVAVTLHERSITK